ncbi:MAG: ADYC domain-containing protein [Nannocystaceae bacterium]
MVGKWLRCVTCSALAISVVGATGCDSPEAYEENFAVGEGRENPSEESLREGQYNGVRMNGVRMNSLRMNAAYLGVESLNALDGSDDYVATLGYDLIGNDEAVIVWLDGSELKILTDEGVTLQGTDLEGIRVHYELDETAHNHNGKHTKRVRLNSVEPYAPGSDIFLYDFEVKNGTGPWEPLCVDAFGDATEAILLSGSWNGENGSRAAEAGVMTYACRGAALAKCAEWGYRPWATGDADLFAYHQACTRMVVADYCGNGIAHTVDGTPIHVLDELGIQELDPNMAFVVEAEWGPAGATCLNVANTRLPGVYVGCEIPACGADFVSGGLIQSGKPTGP